MTPEEKDRIMTELMDAFFRNPNPFTLADVIGHFTFIVHDYLAHHKEWEAQWRAEGLIQ